MLDLLKQTIDGNASGYWLCLPQKEREYFCRFAADKKIEAYFYYFFNKNLPKEFTVKFKQKYQFNAVFALKNDFYRKELFKLLHSNNIRFAPIKGCDLAVNYYPDPALRSYSDWDILIHPDNIPAAIQLLEKNHWQKTEPAEKYENVTYHHYPPFKKNNILLEIHQHLPGFEAQPAEYLWDHITPNPDDAAYTLSAELNLCLLTSHFAVDNYLHMPFVKFILDAGWLLKKSSVDVDILKQISSDCQLAYPGDILGACPDFFDESILVQIGFDRQKSEIFRKIFDYQNKLNHSPGAEWVINKSDKFSFRWWQKRLLHLKPSSIKKSVNAFAEKITVAEYLKIVLAKLSSLTCLFHKKDTQIAEYYKLTALVDPKKSRNTDKSKDNH